MIKLKQVLHSMRNIGDSLANMKPRINLNMLGVFCCHVLIILQCKVQQKLISLLSNFKFIQLWRESIPKKKKKNYFNFLGFQFGTWEGWRRMIEKGWKYLYDGPMGSVPTITFLLFFYKVMVGTHRVIFLSSKPYFPGNIMRTEMTVSGRYEHQKNPCEMTCAKEMIAWQDRHPNQGSH